mgnify:FL=1|tara:strand:+ start:397 stop:555 length:159 start_codon:yes stop_codon:yes gene_type:complete
MKLLNKSLIVVVFSIICLASCKLPPLESYVDPLYLDDENPDAKKELLEKKNK